MINISNKCSRKVVYMYNRKEDQELVDLVIASLVSEHTKRAYKRAYCDFFKYWYAQGKPVMNKKFLLLYKLYLKNKGIQESSLNQRLCAIRILAKEAIDLEIWNEKVFIDFSLVKNIPQRGKKTGTWLTKEEVEELLSSPDIRHLKGKRDQAILSILVGCGLRRSEIIVLKVEQIQKKDQYWVFENLLGKGNKTRTVTIPDWVMISLNQYLEGSELSSGYLFTRMYGFYNLSKKALQGNAIWEIVRKYGNICGLSIAPHDLRRTYAKLSYKFGAKLDQIQLNLGHQSLQTTEVYLGVDLDLSESPGKYLDIQFTNQL